MSKQIIAEIEDIWIKVEAAQEEWNAYLDSLQSKPLVDTEQPPYISDSTRGPTIVARVQEVSSVVTGLESRLQILKDLKATRIRTLGSTAQMISRHLPNQILSTETANSILLRALDFVDNFLEHARQATVICEQLVTKHYNTLRKNYEEVREVVNAFGEVVNARDFARILEAHLKEMAGEGDELQIIAQMLEILAEGSAHANAVVGVVERQVLKFKANVAFVGVRVPRQMLITEFLEE